MDKDKQLSEIIEGIKAKEITIEWMRNLESLSTPDKKHIEEELKAYYTDVLNKDEVKELFHVDELDKEQKEIFTWGTDQADEKFSPIQKSSFILFAGEAGSGKTEFLFDLAMKNATAGIKTLFISLEMESEAVYTRKSMRYAGITKKQWQDKRRVGEHQRNAYFRKKKELKGIEKLSIIGFDTDQETTLETILGEIEKRQPSLAIVDNFNLVARERNINDLEQDDFVSRGFMDFTNKKDIPVIVVHHVNKSKEIRGSQKIIDHADSVMVCKRHDPKDVGATDRQKSEFNVVEVKDRQFGLGGFVTYIFNKGTFIQNDEIIS